jgi:uncharacterized membrane protein YphA (DoxX/SURF4 family)
MKIATLIVRSILGGGFVVFGLNGFFHFIKMGEMAGPAVAFFGALFQTKYMVPLIFGTEAIGGLMVLTGIFLPLGLVLLGPVLVNIIFFHLFLAPGGIMMGIVFSALEAFLVVVYRKYFAGVLTPLVPLW